jgi:hypothetical protein
MLKAVNFLNLQENISFLRNIVNVIMFENESEGSILSINLTKK